MGSALLIIFGSWGQALDPLVYHKGHDVLLLRVMRVGTVSPIMGQVPVPTTPTGLLIQPTAKSTVTLVDKGGGEWLYLEDGDPHPLRVTDSTITIQRFGILYTFSRDDGLYSEWGADIRDIFDSQPAGAKDWDDFRCYHIHFRRGEDDKMMHLRPLFVTLTP